MGEPSDYMDSLELHLPEEVLRKYPLNPIKDAAELLAKAPTRNIHDDHSFMNYALPITSSTITATKFGMKSTFYNNKGLAVENFDLFFDDGQLLNFNARRGSTSSSLYDARDRLIATIYPDHTWTEIVYDTWSVAVYRQNDLVENDPSTDPDVSFAVRYLPQESYSPTWYNARSKEELGSIEKIAAEKSSQHRNM
ncbi:hypothetical protein TrVGV298_000031 [Trichoderma virens]|nr:hypothetical protein TrVGV298_000031 [Trichoderma virens]